MVIPLTKPVFLLGIVELILLVVAVGTPLMGILAQSVAFSITMTPACDTAACVPYVPLATTSAFNRRMVRPDVKLAP